MKGEIILALIFIVFTLVVSFIYFYYYLDRNEVDIFSGIVCFVLFNIFVFLNIIIIIDALFNSDEATRKKTESFHKGLSYFYTFFSFFNGLIRWIIFPICINFYETGYYSIWKIIKETYINMVKKILKMINSLWKKILAIIAIVVAVIIVILVIIYMVKNDLGFSTPLGYINILLNLISIVQIYINVGFYVGQVIIDFKRQRNALIIWKYYFYSKRLILKKAEKYIDKFKKSREELEKAIQDLDKNNNNKYPYHNYIKNSFNGIKEKIKKYQLESIINLVSKKQSNSIENEQKKENNNVDIIVYEINSVHSEENVKSENYQTTENKEGKEEDKEKSQKENLENIENTLAKPLRYYKKSLRKIIKMRKLYKDAEEEKNIDLKKSQFYKVMFFIKYFILFIAFGMVIVTDLVLPLYYYSNKDDNIANATIAEDSTDTTIFDEDDDDSIIVIFFGILLFSFIFILTSGYTIIMVFSTSRRRYISGDFLSGKQINDKISLMKTLREICGFAFALIYCNFYFWKEASDILNNPVFYQEIQIPEIRIKYGISVYMIGKVVVIAISSFIFYFFENVPFFKNDLAEFNRNYNDKNYSYENDEKAFNRLIEGNKIHQFLIKEVN